MASLAFTPLYIVLFMQNTAYELRMSDWSSDVCSSDLFFINSPSILPVSSSTLSLTSSSILPQCPATLHPLYHSLLHQFSLNPPIFFIHFITHFFINSPSIPFDSSSTLSLTSS